MKNRILNAFLIITIAVITFSCGVISLENENKDAITNPEFITVEDLFPSDGATLITALTNDSAITWKVTGFTLGGSDTFQDCRLDDTFELKNDGTYNFDGGSKDCGKEDVARKTGTWEVDFDSRMLTFDINTSDELSVKIETCGGSKVIISSSYFGMDIVSRFEQ